MDATLQRFAGAAIVASDIPASLHFWVDFAGAEIIAEGTPDGRLPWRLALGGVDLELYAAREDQMPAPGSENQHFCWDIEPVHVDWWLQRALNWGMRPRTVSVHHNGLELGIYWDDPDGYHFEVAAHYCTDAELVKAHGERKDRLRQLMALPKARFTRDTGPARTPALANA
jgi:catechol 2,3-dioxygenase-like lactoylglutathione lyase family enzyme